MPMETRRDVASSSPGGKIRWRRLSLVELEAEILRIQRSAVRAHLAPSIWRRVDNMRKRRAMLLKQ